MRNEDHNIDLLTGVNKKQYPDWKTAMLGQRTERATHRVHLSRILLDLLLGADGINTVANMDTWRLTDFSFPLRARS